MSCSVFMICAIQDHDMENLDAAPTVEGLEPIEAMVTETVGIAAGQASQDFTVNANDGYGADVYEAMRYGFDGDGTNLSEAIQEVIYQIWQRIAKDYAPFDLNPMTNVSYDSNNMGGLNTVAHALISSTSDANGETFSALWTRLDSLFGGEDFLLW